MVRGWYIQLGHLRGVPILFHIATPLGAWVFTHRSFEPMAWLGFFVLVLFHEMGHALMARKAGAWVERVEILPMGGTCVWVGNVTPLARACIAFAGIWMQLLILCIAAPMTLAWFDSKLPGFTKPLIKVLTGTNLVMIAINLLPVAPFDGAEAWKLFPLLVQKIRRGTRKKQLEAKLSHLQAELDAMDKQQEPSEEKKRTYLN
jgi:stage IV sporulation protein FB